MDIHLSFHTSSIDGYPSMENEWKMYINGTINGYQWMEDKWNKNGYPSMDDYRYIDGKL